jgi:hypothetical protein
MSTILKTPVTVQFDASNPEHRKAFVDFLNTGKWSIKFDLDFPFTSLPSLILFKLAAFACADVGVIDTDDVFRKANMNPVDAAKASNIVSIMKAA